MKHIGLVGGLSPESTIEYYRIICRGCNRRNGGLEFPAVSIYSMNLAEIAALQDKGDWEEVGARIVDALWRLRWSGAEFAAIATNTPHNALDHILPFSPLPVLSIMDATAERIRRDGAKTVGLLGTRQTMEYGFFQKAFRANGIETLLPDEEGRKFVDSVIWGELVHGIMRKKSRLRFQEIIRGLIREGAEGVILGCTEIPLLIRPADVPVTLYNTTTIHANAILAHAMGSKKTQPVAWAGRG